MKDEAPFCFILHPSSFILSKEGRGARDKVALASGWTVPEAQAAGVLPYQILPALRRGDPVTLEECHRAMIEEGGSTLLDGAMQLRFATEEEAKAAVARLSQRLPGSEPVWVINREITAQDFARAQEAAENGG